MANIFRVTGPLCGESNRSLVNSPHKEQGRRALTVFLSAPEQMFQWTIKTSLIWEAIAPIMTSL